MMKRYRSFITVAGLLGIIFLVLGGFRGDVPDVNAAAQDDSIVIAFPSDFPTMDPHMHTARIGILKDINVFDSLLHRNPKIEFEPSLATAWKALDDTTWEFTLRKGVKFHNGDPFTAEDVQFSIHRVLNPQQKSPQYGNIRGIKEVKILDDYKIHIITDKPFPLLMERMVYFPIIPKNYVQKVGDEVFGTTGPVGTGPYKHIEWKRDQYLKLEAFEEHWRGKSAIKYLTYRIIPEVASQVAELKTGGIDMIRNVPPDLMNDLKSHPNTYVTDAPILRVHYVGLDTRVPPFDKKLVRQAANYAIDRQAIIEKLLFGLGKPVATMINPMAFGYDPTVEGYTYDPARAKKLMAEAGYSNGVDITFHTGDSGVWRSVHEVIAQMLTDVGIRVNLKVWDPGPTFTKFLQQEGKATNGYHGSWGYYSVFDADAILHPLYHSEPGGLYGRHYPRHPEIDKLGLDQMMDEARSTLDQGKRKKIYSEMQKLLKEHAPTIFLFHQFDMLGVTKRVEYEARGDEWIWVFDAKIRKKA